MNFRIAIKRNSRLPSLRLGGFSFPELMISMTILILVIGALLGLHLFGMRTYELARAKLGASDDARKAISQLASEVRSAKNVRIGDGTIDTFTPVATGTPQVGTALRIFPTTNTAVWTQYYWDAGVSQLRRTSDGVSATTVVTASVTNQNIFSAEDFAGTLATTRDNNRVIGLNLQFLQQWDTTLGAHGELGRDYYAYRTRMTLRATD